VMELAKGGHLFDRIMRDGSLTERYAASLTLQIASALEFMHAKGIVHRDMKPENLLLADDSKAALVKICDFGLSKAFNKSALALDDHAMVMKTRVGTQWYASPELIQRADTYDASIDLWGLGLIVFIMLTGTHPFEEVEDMYGATVNARVAYTHPVWARLAPSAQAFVSSLLKAKPAERLTAAQCREHEWLRDGVARDEKLGVSLSYLRRFQVDHLHGVLMKLIAQRLDDEELAEVRAVFEALDADAKGFLSADDLRDALSEKMSTLRVGDRYNATALLRSVCFAAELDVSEEASRATRAAAEAGGGGGGGGSGRLRGISEDPATPQSKATGHAPGMLAVTWEMFLAAALEEDDSLVRRHADALFAAMDVDGSGSISASDVRAVLDDLHVDLGDDEVTRMVGEYDGDGSGNLNYHEFGQALFDRSRRLRIEALSRRAATAAARGPSPAPTSARSSSRRSERRSSRASSAESPAAASSASSAASRRPPRLKPTVSSLERDWNRRLATVIEQAAETTRGRMTHDTTHMA